jgi:chromosome segregation ATPase
LAAVRTELEVQLTEAQLEAQHAKSEAMAAAERSAQTEAAAAQLTANLRELADSLDQLERDRQAAGEENQRLSRALEAAQAAAAEARAGFTSDLKIVRDALATAEERARAAEQRSLLEIDQGRQRGARVVKRLEAERDSLVARLAQQEVCIAEGGVQLGEARSQIAGLESALTAAQGQILAQSKALTEIFGRMDAMQKAITAQTTSPSPKTSGRVRGKAAHVTSPRTRAAKAGR